MIGSATMNLSEMFDEFLAYCEHERHLSANTLAAYHQDIKEFRRFRQLATAEEMTGDHIVAYSTYLSSVRRLEGVMHFV